MKCWDARSDVLSRFTYALPNPAWFARNREAWHAPAGAERGLVDLMNGLITYADAHERRFDTALGNDSVLGPAWLKMLQAWRTLLNGDLGRLDGGTLDKMAFAVAEAAGFKRSDVDESDDTDDDNGAGDGGVRGKP